MIRNKEVILETKALEKHFGGIQAVDKVDLKLYRNEILGIVGDNGAGKSSLIKTITGVYRKDGYILGVGIAIDGFAEYYNLGHYDIKPGEKEKNLNFLKEVLALDIPKIGANLLYDIDWLENFQGLKVNGKYNDIQVAEPLINEYRRSNSFFSGIVNSLSSFIDGSVLASFSNFNIRRSTILEENEL